MFLLTFKKEISAFVEYAGNISRGTHQANVKVNYECASCMLRQSREAIENSVEDYDKRMDITLEVLDFMGKNFKKNTNSNKLGTDLHHMIMKLTDNDDPYKLYREEGNNLAKKLLMKITHSKAMLKLQSAETSSILVH